HLFCAEKVETVADDERAVPAFRLQQAGRGADAVIRRSASLLGNDVLNTCTMLDEVFSADLRFGKIWIRSVTAGRNDGVSQSVLVELERMIEAGLEHRRRTAIILCRSQYNDGVRRARFFSTGEVTDCTIYMDEVNHYGE